MSKNTYSAMMDELRTILHDMQSKDVDVDAAVTKYKRGLELTKELQDYLKKTENVIVERSTTSGIDKALS